MLLVGIRENEYLLLLLSFANPSKLLSSGADQAKGGLYNNDTEKQSPKTGGGMQDASASNKIDPI